MYVEVTFSACKNLTIEVEPPPKNPAPIIYNVEGVVFVPVFGVMVTIVGAVVEVVNTNCEVAFVRLVAPLQTIRG